MREYEERPVELPTRWSISCSKEGLSCASTVNEHFYKMVALRLVYAKIIIFSGFVHLALANVSKNAIVGPGHKLWLQSLIGNDEIVPKVTSFVEDLIAPILRNSTNIPCRKHTDIYMDGLRNGTTWAYHSK
jgi:hypothetical protein